jgi:hypothetical protein
MPDFKTIDSKMTNKRKDDLLIFANDNGFEYISEMLYEWHVKNMKSPAWIADKILTETGEVLFGKSGLYYFFTVQNWLIKGLMYTPMKAKVSGRICSCCQSRPVPADKHMLCNICFMNAPPESSQGLHSSYNSNW